MFDFVSNYIVDSKDNNESDLAISNLVVDAGLQFSPCWPMLGNVGHVVIFVSQIVSALDLGLTGLSAGHTLTDHLRSSGLASEEETGLGDQIRHQCPDSS